MFGKTEKDYENYYYNLYPNKVQTKQNIVQSNITMNTGRNRKTIKTIKTIIDKMLMNINTGEQLKESE